MDVYGLTGGIGSGKSAVAAMIEEFGIPVVSADELSRIVVTPGSEGLDEVVRNFGPEILDAKGELDRRKLAAAVFDDADKRRVLEAILHPRIRQAFAEILTSLEGAGHDVVVYEIPLLFEKNLQGEMKAVILVTAPEHLRIARVVARDGISAAEVRARIASQWDDDTKRRLADYVIENDGDLDDLRRETEFLIARFLRIDRVRARPVHDHAWHAKVDLQAPRPVGVPQALLLDETLPPLAPADAKAIQPRLPPPPASTTPKRLSKPSK